MINSERKVTYRPNIVILWVNQAVRFIIALNAIRMIPNSLSKCTRSTGIPARLFCMAALGLTSDFVLLHIAHVRTYTLISVVMPCQKNEQRMRVSVSFCPG